ncbi:MAG: RNA 2',3'-cyclic phosphodiesterase [Planctomycetaceae bacterium]
MSHRLFIAVDLPEAVRRRLARLVADAPRGVRPVRPEQIHLTLHFLGDADDAAMVSLATALGRVDQPAFAIDLVGIGVFPSRGRPAVLWAGVAESEPLRSLHGAVADVLMDCGFTPETRPWAAHVTLARLAPQVPREWTAELLERHRGATERGIAVTAIRLYESTRFPEGTVHAPVATIALGRA